MTARIYRDDKFATSSGLARTDLWHLVHDAETRKEIDPLMGWVSSGDMRQQIHLTFPSREEAIAYASRNGLAYRVEEPHDSKPKTLSYADNFKFNRPMPWTH